MGTESKIISCDLPDINIPELTFSQMCWSRVDQYKENVALVGIALFDGFVDHVV